MDAYAKVKQQVFQAIDAHREDIIHFLQDLIRIPSPEGGGHHVQEFVADYFRDMGADQVDVFKPDIAELEKFPGYSPVYHEHGGTPVEEKPVVVATFKGTGGGRSLMFAGHMESATREWEPTIAEQWNHDPWGAEIEGDTLYGRAARNMKSGNAAGIMALKYLRAAGIKLKGDVLISTNIDEDIGCQGTLEAIRRGYTADAGICPEPTGMALGVASPGCQHFRVVVKGRPHYAAGISAIDNVVKVYEAIKELDEQRTATKITPWFDANPHIPSSYPICITVGMLRAGTWPCTTPMEATLEGSLRHVPGEEIIDVRSQLKEQIVRCAEQDAFMKENPPRVEWWEYWNASEVDRGEPITQTMREAFTEVRGEDPTYSTSVGDATFLIKYAGIPTVYLGPENGTPSSPYEETISIKSYLQLTKIFALTTLKWCGYE